MAKPPVIPILMLAVIAAGGCVTGTARRQMSRTWTFSLDGAIRTPRTNGTGGQISFAREKDAGPALENGAMRLGRIHPLVAAVATTSRA